MNLRELLDVLPHEKKVELAERAGTTYIYLFQLASDSPNARKPSPKLAQRLAAADSRLKLSDLRPDIWGKRATH